MLSTVSDRGTVAPLIPRTRSDSGIHRTSPGLLKRAAMAQWSEALAQYVAIRIGDARRGQRAFAALRRMVRNLPPSELLQPPGPKAHLYRMARSLADVERAMPEAAKSKSLPWRERSSRLARVLTDLREALGEEDAELLELRHARELTPAEIACVLELPVDEVELKVDTAEARARKFLGTRAPDPLSQRATIYVQAFALARGWQEDGGESLELELSTDNEALDAGTLVGGRYQIERRVGTGAFGDVYRASDIEIPGHCVALKMLRQPSLSEASRQSALRELKLNAAVSHPSLVQFKDHGWFDQRLWFVMPWYEGETLEERIRRGGLSRTEARHIFEPLARALAALHEAGIRHQDIKPENILLTRLPGYGLEDEVLPVLIDLGVAAEEQETMLGGTPLYFAPEVARRFLGRGDLRQDIDGTADVFALSLSLRNALEPESQDDVPAGAIQAFVEGRAEESPALFLRRDLRFLRPAFTRWLHQEPSERPSAEQLAEELKILTAPEERRERRWRMLRVLLPVLAVIAAVFSFVVHELDRRAEAQARAALLAQEEAEGVRSDLVEENARRQALEAGHAELLERYEASRLTRRQLAEELASRESELRGVEGRLDASERQSTTLRERLTAAQSRETTLTASLEQTRSDLAESTSLASQLDRAVSAGRERETRLNADLQRVSQERASAREELAARTTELASSRAEARRTLGQITELESALAAARTDISAARAASAAARSERDTARTELAALRQRVDQLVAAVRSEESDPPPATAEAAP